MPVILVVDQLNATLVIVLNCFFSELSDCWKYLWYFLNLSGRGGKLVFRLSCAIEFIDEQELLWRVPLQVDSLF